MRKPLLVHPGVRHAKRPNCLAAGMLAMALSPALAYAAEPAGVGPVVPGDVLEGTIDGLPPLQVAVV